MDKLLDDSIVVVAANKSLLVAARRDDLLFVFHILVLNVLPEFLQ